MCAQIKKMSGQIYKELKLYADPTRAKHSLRFFKCGKGQYGEGDLFLGITVPQLRKTAKKYFQDISFEPVQELLESVYHEHRLLGLLFLVYKFDRSTEKEQAKIYRFYKKNIRRINNWDLVDVTTPRIVGEYLWDHVGERKILKRWTTAKNMWERRIAVLATFAFIKRGRFQESFDIAKALLQDPEDLLHKAVGWMLREVGKRDQVVLEKFLLERGAHMPRTTLRYAIERFDEKKRKEYLLLK